MWFFFNQKKNNILRKKWAHIHGKNLPCRLYRVVMIGLSIKISILTWAMLSHRYRHKCPTIFSYLCQLVFWLVWFCRHQGAPVFPVMYVAQLKYDLMFLGSVTCVQLKGANSCLYSDELRAENLDNVKCEKIRVKLCVVKIGIRLDMSCLRLNIFYL